MKTTAAKRTTLWSDLLQLMAASAGEKFNLVGQTKKLPPMTHASWCRRHDDWYGSATAVCALQKNLRRLVEALNSMFSILPFLLFLSTCFSSLTVADCLLLSPARSLSAVAGQGHYMASSPFMMPVPTQEISKQSQVLMNLLLLVSNRPACSCRMRVFTSR